MSRNDVQIVGNANGGWQLQLSATCAVTLHLGKVIALCPVVPFSLTMRDPADIRVRDCCWATSTNDQGPGLQSLEPELHDRPQVQHRNAPTEERRSQDAPWTQIDHALPFPPHMTAQFLGWFGWSNYSRATVTGARPDIPSACAAAGVTSMMRPRTNGPRSLMVTTTERPLL